MCTRSQTPFCDKFNVSETSDSTQNLVYFSKDNDEVQLFVVQAVGRIISGRSVSKIIMIVMLSFRAATLKNKKYQWGYLWKRPHLFTPWFNAVSVLTFCLCLFCCNRKEKDHVRRKINSKNKSIYAWNQYYYYFGLPKIRVSQAHTTKN